MTLIIVESPNKCAKIKGYLGDGYIVKASCGHIRDLAEGLQSIEIDNNFAPRYQITPDKQRVVSDLRDAVRTVGENNVILATDDDREGESIAYHLAIVLNLSIVTCRRAVFHEITQKAVRDAVANPRTIDMNMVNAQQARRVADRLIGFQISPYVQKSLSNYTLSAGRCQTPALRFIVDREREIAAFDGGARYNVVADFRVVSGVENMMLEDVKLNVTYPNNDGGVAIREFLSNCRGDIGFSIMSFDMKMREQNPSAPFTTSTIQQEVSHRFHMNPQICMSILQQLFEGGMITYHRTDSKYLSDTILNEIQTWMLSQSEFAEYHQRRQYGNSNISASATKKKKGATPTTPAPQAAHEAIRPTKISRDDLDEKWTEGHRRVYRAIWMRTVQSQMRARRYKTQEFGLIPPWNPRITPVIMSGLAEDDMISGSVGDGPIMFKTTMEITIDPGFTILEKGYDEVRGENVMNQQRLWRLLEMTEITCGFLTNIVAEQKPRSGPTRYTEASLIAQLEKSGIGRPSTFASLVMTIIDRGYVSRTPIIKEDELRKLSEIQYEKLSLVFSSSSPSSPSPLKIEKKRAKVPSASQEKGKLWATDLGMMVCDILYRNFTNIFEYGFTAKVESNLDLVAQGEINWPDVVREIYDMYNPILRSILADKTAIRQIASETGQIPQEFVFHRESREYDYAYCCIWVKLKYLICRIRELPSSSSSDILEKPVAATPARRGRPPKVAVAARATVASAAGIAVEKRWCELPPQISAKQLFSFADLDEITRKNVIDWIQLWTDLPREIGIINEHPVMLKHGQYGFYLQWNNVNKSLGKDVKSVPNLTLEQAEILLGIREDPAKVVRNVTTSSDERRKRGPEGDNEEKLLMSDVIDVLETVPTESRVLKMFGNAAKTSIRIGPYGWYILHNGKIASFPKNTKWTIENIGDITITETEELFTKSLEAKKRWAAISAARGRGGRGGSRGGGRGRR